MKDIIKNYLNLLRIQKLTSCKPRIYDKIDINNQILFIQMETQKIS